MGPPGLAGWPDAGADKSCYCAVDLAEWTGECGAVPFTAGLVAGDVLDYGRPPLGAWAGEAGIDFSRRVFDKLEHLGIAGVDAGAGSGGVLFWLVGPALDVE